MPKNRLFEKFKTSIIPAFFLIFSLLVYGPLELCLTNRGSEEFWFSYADILIPPLILAFISFWAVVGLLIILPEKLYRAGLAVVVAAGVLLFLQGTFLPNGYGELNGAEINWDRYTLRAIYNTFIWLAILVTALVWAMKNWNAFRSAAIYAAVLVLSIQCISLVAIEITGRGKTAAQANDAGDVFLTTEKEFTVSKDKNTIVFILDAFDSQLMCDLLEQYPDELHESFEDFTFYHNTSGGATRTKYAIPFILTGRTNDTGDTYNYYLKDSFQTSPLFQELRTGKYDTGFYTESGYVDRKQDVAIDNLSAGIALKPTSAWGLAGSLLKMAAFKYAPHLLKPAFWMYSFELSQWKGGAGEIEAYKINDVDFYKTLRKTGLSASGSEPGFRFIHLNGAHAPYTINENIEKVSDEQASEARQGLASLRIVAEYVRQLKSLDLYDDAAIIVMADHGDSLYLKDTMSIDKKYEHNPLLLVKASHENHDFIVSETRLTYRDAAHIIADMLQRSVNIEKDFVCNDTVFFYVGSDDNNSYTIIEYASDGNAYDHDSYHETGVVFHNENINNDYVLGTRLYFGDRNGATIKPYLVKGFSYIDPDYTWSSDYIGELRFTVGNIERNLMLTLNYEYAYKSFQRCFVYASDHLVGSFIARERGTQSFVIPKEDINDGMLTITMQFPDAYNPVAHNEGVDNRLLGIGFDTVVIDATNKPFDEGQLQIKEYELGTIVIFGANGNWRDYAVSGISEDQWTNAPKASIQFPAFASEGDLSLNMAYNIYGDRQRVIVYANEVQIADYIAEQREDKEITIPKELLQNGTLRLDFEFPDAKMPENGDKRELALWMEKLTIREAD